MVESAESQVSRHAQTCTVVFISLCNKLSIGTPGQHLRQHCYPAKSFPQARQSRYACVSGQKFVNKYVLLSYMYFIYLCRPNLQFHYIFHLLLPIIVSMFVINLQNILFIIDSCYELRCMVLSCPNSRYVVIPQYFFKKYRGTIFSNTAHLYL